MLILLFLKVWLFSAVFAETWETVYPGGDTLCAFGGDYAFFYRMGRHPNKVVFEFQGGGACWDEPSCSSGALYTTSVNVNGVLSSLNNANGVQDHANPRNPFQEWTHIFIPYCSGDLFVGDVYNEYSSRSVYHKGAKQAKEAEAWAFENIVTDNVTHVAVTGCSAGGFGALFQAPVIFEGYNRAQKFMLDDSGMGYVTTGQLEGGRDTWGLEAFLTSGPVHEWKDIDYSFPGGAVQFTSDVMGLATQHYREAMFSVFTANADAVQYGFYLASEFITPQGWSTGMRAVVDETHRKAPHTNYASWINNGFSHCIIPGNGFYTTSTDGVNLADWVGALVERVPVQQKVDCEDDGSC